MSIPAAGPGLFPPPVTPVIPAAPTGENVMGDQLARALRIEPLENPTGSRGPVGSPSTWERPAQGVAGTTETPVSETLRQAVEAVADHQRRLDQAIELARSGRSFSPQELLALQARTHRFAHDLSLVTKTVEQVTTGIKRTLETQI